MIILVLSFMMGFVFISYDGALEFAHFASAFGCPHWLCFLVGLPLEFLDYLFK